MSGVNFGTSHVGASYDGVSSPGFSGVGLEGVAPLPNHQDYQGFQELFPYYYFPLHIHLLSLY